MISTQHAPEAATSSTRHRKILRCRAELHLDTSRTVVARTIDIATGGVSLVAQQTLAPGTRCTIVFALPSRGALHAVAAEAEVAYTSCQGSQGFRLGLSFISADPARDRLIHTLL